MANAHRIDDTLTLLELPLPRPGFGGFLGTWIHRGDRTFVVDPGPAASVHHLIRYLRNEGIHHLDTILLTHIHIDHAGGLRGLLEAFPEARAVCHQKAIPHLVDPSRLWEASRNTLGDVALAYGEILPVPRERLVPHTEADLPGMTVSDTPGHAAHHLSFCYENRLFAGEAGGVCLAWERPGYLRPSTPPRFILEKNLDSLDRLLEEEDRMLCYAHFGTADSSHRMLALHREQLLFWHDLLREKIEAGGGEEREVLLEYLLKEDPRLEGFSRLHPSVQERERFFLKNSLEGFLGYLEAAGREKAAQQQNG